MTHVRGGFAMRTGSRGHDGVSVVTHAALLRFTPLLPGQSRGRPPHGVTRYTSLVGLGKRLVSEPPVEWRASPLSFMTASQSCTDSSP